MSYLYLASPYTHKDASVRLGRYLRALHATTRLMAQGECVYSPIVHGYYIEKHLPENLSTSHEFWMKHCRQMLRGASKMVVLMLEGWTASRGIGEELHVCSVCHIPVQFIRDDE